MTNSLFHSVKYKKILTIKQRIYQRVLKNMTKENEESIRNLLLFCNYSIFRHDNFIGCFSADKIKMSVRKYFCFYYCPIKILQNHKIRADFICEVSPFSLDFSRQTIKSNHGQKYTF